MAVEAVASVVIQKLTDMLTEESTMHQQVIVEQLQEIKRALETMGGFFIDAEEKQEADEKVKNWADKYICHLYDVEDTIETFALRIARQRKRLGFLMNHALFLKNFTAYRNLNCKIRRIRGGINQLNRGKPGGIEDASINSTLRSTRFNLDSAPPPTANHDEIPRDLTRDQKEEAGEAGSLLSTKKDYGECQDILSSQPNWETKDILSGSYNDLPAHLKLCLLYTVLFPKAFDIPVRRLLRLWLAEGFVKRPDISSSQTQEDVVKKYFDELVLRSFIEVSKLTSDGSPKRCRLLGVPHDFLMPKAKVISLFHVHDKSDTCQVAAVPFGARRLVQCRDMNDWEAARLQSLRSYFSFNSQLVNTPAREVGNLLRKIIGSGSPLLRVLDLEGVYKPSLPENLGDLFHLQYLGLRKTFLYALPKSVGQLHYLEALDIKHTYIESLPTFIWKLKRLKHLNANGICLDSPSGHSLPQLLTLWGFSVDDESLVKDGLNSSLHLRKLGITFNLSNSEALLDWISNSTAIQTLRLWSKDDVGRPSKLILKPLSNLKQLTMLNLLGKLQALSVDYFPQGLKVVTLSCSQLRNDPMPILAMLPNLTVLELLAESYLGEKMVCPRGGFKQLRALKLWMLKNLKQWDVEGAAMERLQELNIRCCDLLTTIPCRLLRQRSLELTLTNMPDKFREQVEKTKLSHVTLIVKDYNFFPLPWEGADDDS